MCLVCVFLDEIGKIQLFKLVVVLLTVCHELYI